MSTATAIAPLAGYKESVSHLHPSQLLGYILWYSISGEVERIDGKRTSAPIRVSRQWFEDNFEQLGLDDRLLPPRIKPVDAFKQASTEIRGDYPLTNVDQEVTLRVIDVDSDKETITRFLMRDVTDRRTQNVNTSVMAEIKFFRGDPTRRGTAQSGEHKRWIIKSVLQEVGLDMKYTGGRQTLADAERAIAEKLLQRFDARYADLCANYSAQAVRAVIRNYVTHLNAIACKPSGGVYFVHTSRAKQVAALEELVNRIGQGCTFHSLPLEDTTKQRRMLTDAFQDEVQDECELLRIDIAKAMAAAKEKGSKISTDKYAEFSRRLGVITDCSTEYTSKLGLAQGRSAVSIEATMDLVDELAGQLAVRTAR